MTPEKTTKIKELRNRLANLSEVERQALISRGLIATAEGRTLSLHNTYLIYLQSNGVTPTIVGGYQQWRKAGKQVKKGEHGYTLWFPVGVKDQNGELTEVVTYYTGTVFDISQTEVLEAS